MGAILSMRTCGDAPEGPGLDSGEQGGSLHGKAAPAVLPLLGPQTILGCCPIVPGLIGAHVLPAASGRGWCLSLQCLPALTAGVAEPC